MFNPTSSELTGSTGDFLYSLPIVMTAALATRYNQVSPQEQTLRDVVAGHVRSLMVNHLADVPSSDQHTVKPWFNGKLDASPPVVDPASQGFPLIGGRLDYIHNRVVGALVFKHDQHVINLFVWPVSDANDSGPASATREGFNLLHWTCSGMTFWAVSDVNPEDLKQFADLVRAAATAPTTTSPR